MMRHGISALLVALVLVFSLALAPAAAQPAMRHSFGAGYWFASFSTNEVPGPTLTWSRSFLTFDYRGISLESPWGFHLRYASGSADSFWTADVTYHLLAPSSMDSRGLDFRVFAGYGSYHFTLPGATVDTAGFRVGAETAFALGAAIQGLFLTARVAWAPSNSVTVSGTSVGTRSGTEWSVGLRYKIPSKFTHGASSPGYTLTSTLGGVDLDPSWSAEVEYTSDSSGSTSGSGIYFQLTKTLP